MKILLAKPRGFCAGVERAVQIVELALERYGPPIYVRHEIVHNAFVVSELKKKGVIFVDELAEIPSGAITIFSAHGVSEQVEIEAKNRNLPVIDATCPLVTKVHKEAQKSEAEGRQIILIGHTGHAEVEGTSGRVKQQVLLVQSAADVASLEVNDPSRLAYVTQTTLSVDDTREIIAALKTRFPEIHGPELRDICYATTNRQNAVKQMATLSDIVLVIGSPSSSNSNRLRDLAASLSIPAYLVSTPDDIDHRWFDNTVTIGVTAGASAPEVLVRAILNHICHHFPGTVIEEMVGISENVNFKLPMMPELST